MLVKELELTNFRNYQKCKFTFAPTTIITGPNGIGKTNILEALFILATSKSFRAKDERNLINNNKNYAQIRAQINPLATPMQNLLAVDFFIFKKNLQIIKQVKINGINKKLIDLIGQLKMVLFSPESLQIISGSPFHRRRFINMILAQTDTNYALNLMSLKKVLAQRNQLLKLIAGGKAREKELSFWDKKLIEVSTHIIKKRKKFMEFINQYITDQYQEINQKTTEKLVIKYISNILDTDRYQDILAAGRKKELLAQKTLYSPHLDDLLISIKNKPFREIASRGEIRSLIIALKMIELNFLETTEKTFSTKTLILLDDVFSELDKKRRGTILKIIQGRQSIITTTEAQTTKNININTKIINLIK